MLQIAGAAAAEGLNLKEVAAVAAETAKQCRSVGVATRICTLPGATPSDRSTVQVPSALNVLFLLKLCETCIASPKIGSKLLLLFYCYFYCYLLLCMYAVCPVVLPNGSRRKWSLPCLALSNMLIVLLHRRRGSYSH